MTISSDNVNKIRKWLLEYQLASDMSLIELNELCYQDSDWIFNNIF